MMNSIFKKSSWTVLLPAGIFFFLLFTSPVFADYSGHVASFKSEKNAIKFVNKMKSRGIFAFYLKEEIPGKGELYRSYVGRYKTRPQAKKALSKLKKNRVIAYYQIQKAVAKSGKTGTKKTQTAALKGKSEQQPPVESKDTIFPVTSQKPDGVMMKETDNGKKEPQAQKPDLTPMEHFNLGLKNIDEGRHEAALDDLNRAISADNTFSTAYNKRCFVFYLLGNVDSAVKDCTSAITLKPDFAEAYYNRGLVHHAANQIESAIADFGRAVTLDGNYGSAYAKRGYMYYLSGRSKQAIDDYTTAIGIKPDDGETYFNRALAYHDSDQADKAIADVQKACALKNEQACQVAEDMAKK